VEDEVQQAQVALTQTKAVIDRIVSYELSQNKWSRTLVLIDKIENEAVLRKSTFTLSSHCHVVFNILWLLSVYSFGPSRKFDRRICSNHITEVQILNKIENLNIIPEKCHSCILVV
jgi:hypothetical protein